MQFKNINTTSNNIVVNSDLIPNETNTVSLGTSMAAFKEAYVKTAIVGGISISSNQDGLIIGKAPANLPRSLINNRQKFYRDTLEPTVDLYIPSGMAQLGEATTLMSSADGTLFLPATTKIGGISPGTIAVNGNVPDPTLLPQTAIIGDCYVSSDSGHLYVCTEVSPNTVWTDVGPFQGKKGPQGVQGGPGVAAAGIFTLAPVSGYTGANVSDSNSILSIPSLPTATTDQLYNGRVQSTNSYINTPTVLSFSVSAALNPTVPALANGELYCAVGFSNNPFIDNDVRQNGFANFEAGFNISLNTFTIISNNNNYNATNNYFTWDNNTIFTIVYDGNCFNYFITNIPNQIIYQQVFSTTMDGNTQYYFLASIATGLQAIDTTDPTNSRNITSPIISITNINIMPYLALNPRICFGSSTGNWTITNPLSYLDINNVYVLPPASTLISQTLIPTTGFVFSFITFSTSGTNCLITDNIPALTTNISGTFNLYFSDYSMFYYSNNGLSQSYISEYNVGDVIQIVYKVVNAGTNNLTVYQNQFLVYTSNNFSTTNSCTATIMNSNDSTNIAIQNPQFYYYQ
jgi:hypothetical protein